MANDPVRRCREVGVGRRRKTVLEVGEKERPPEKGEGRRVAFAKVSTAKGNAVENNCARMSFAL